MSETFALQTEASRPRPLRLCAQPAGADAVDSGLVELVVHQLNRVEAAAHLSLCRALGEILLDSLFGGDVDAFVQIGRDHASLKAVLAHRGLRPSSSLTWYSLNLLPQLRAFGEELSEALPMAHHRILIHLKDEDVKLALARRAVAERLTKRDLEAEVDAWRRADEVKRGRRRPGRPKAPRFEEKPVGEAPRPGPGPMVDGVFTSLSHAASLARRCRVDRQAMATMNPRSIERAIEVAERCLGDVEEFLDRLEQALGAR